MYTNLVTVREDGSTYSAEITMSIGNDGRMGLGPIWTLVLVEQNNETECEKLQREISDDWERIPEIPF